MLRAAKEVVNIISFAILENQEKNLSLVWALQQKRIGI
jgi:hypothetical protein